MIRISLGNTILKSRLEPIVDMRSDIQAAIGYEMLSSYDTREVHHPDQSINIELFFKCISKNALIDYTMRQLEWYQKLTSQYNEYKTKPVFINLRRDMLTETDIHHCLIPFLKHYNIFIEIDAPQTPFNAEELNTLKALKIQGAGIWIDDYFGFDCLDMQYVDGIKIDRKYFWSCFERRQPIMFPLSLPRNMVVVEGIETIRHRHYACALGFDYGQGYLWGDNTASALHSSQNVIYLHSNRHSAPLFR